MRYTETHGRTPQAREERRVEKERKAAIRASWLDGRSSAAREQRSRTLRKFNRTLRAHLTRWHPDDAPPELDWDLDAFHEQLHGRD